MTKLLGFLNFGGTKIHDKHFFMDFYTPKQKNTPHEDDATLELPEELARASVETISVTPDNLLPYPRPPIIGIGTVGTRIVENIATILEQGFPEPPKLFSINIGEESTNKQESVTYVTIPSEQQGTNRQYLQGLHHFKIHETQLIDQVISPLKQQTNKGRLVFLIFGAGGTGVGGALHLAQTLKSQGFIPVAIHILPLTSENTLTLYNSAVALYRLSLARIQDAIGIITIPIDQEQFYKKNKNTPHETLIKQINYRIATLLVELIKSILIASDGYIIDYSDFESVFSNYKGLGILFYGSALITESKGIPHFIETTLNNGRSIDHNPLTGTRGYVFLQTPQNLLTAKDYEEFLRIFSKSDVFPRIKEADNDHVLFMGVMTGGSLPEKIKLLLNQADEMRVNILNREIAQVTGGETMHNADKLAHIEGEDARINVQTLEEIQNQEKNNKKR